MHVSQLKMQSIRCIYRRLYNIVITLIVACEETPTTKPNLQLSAKKENPPNISTVTLLCKSETSLHAAYRLKIMIYYKSDLKRTKDEIEDGFFWPKIFDNLTFIATLDSDVI